MDRMIVYPGAIPLDTDVLNAQRATMTALGFLAQACLGSQPVIDGLATTPTVPASLGVTVGPGSITAATQVDTLAYGTLAPDSDNLVKMGINTEATSFTLTAPTVSGESINYLIEAAFQETDTDPVVLPYYNPANPAQGFAGAANSGAAQNTLRVQSVGLQLLAGAARNTGSQTTPPVDAGYVPVAVITVNYGQTAITSSDIVVPGAAPLIPWKLPQLDFQSSPTRSGWQALPSGIVIQWGTGLVVTGNLDHVSFPIPFPNAALSVVASEGAATGWNNPASSSPVPTIYGTANLSASGFSLSCVTLLIDGAQSTANYSHTAGYYWLAIGY